MPLDRRKGSTNCFESELNNEAVAVCPTTTHSTGVQTCKQKALLVSKCKWR